MRIWTPAFLVTAVLLAPSAHAQDRSDGPDGEEVAGAEPLLEEPAEPILDPPSRGPRPLGITVSGAVSLGSYEAGYLYYLVESLRTIEDRIQPRTFTGTSSGSINAFIALLSHCSAPEHNPAESMFYRTWMPIGLDQLYDEEQVTPNSIFTRDGFEGISRILGARFDSGLREGCDVLLGTTVTRARPETVPMAHQQLALPRMTERFLLRVHGRGAGQPPLVTNHRPELLRSLEMPLLPLDGPGAHPFLAIRDTLFASSGFPLAFEPQPVAHCPSSRSPDGRCEAEQVTSAEFLDGAFFTNVPIDLTAFSLQEPDDDNRGRLPDDALFLTISPVPRSYPVAQPAEEDPNAPTDLLPFVLTVLEGFIETTLSAALGDFLVMHPEVDERMRVSRAYHPPASDQLGGFAGFFEEEFRRYDFFLGMTHAHHMLEELRASPSTAADFEGLVPLEEQVGETDEAWRRYRCLRAALDGEGDPRSVCAGPALAGFRALAAVSVERVYDACHPDRVGDDPRRLAQARLHPDCRRALAGEPPPATFGHELGAFERTDDNELLWVFRRLAHHGFRFEDLGVNAPNGDAAYGALRDRLASMARRLASRQGALSPLLQAAVQSGMDAIAYRPESHVVYLDLGGSLMLGWSATTSAAPWLRGVVAVEGRGLTTLLSTEPDWFALTPLLGIEVEPTPISSGTLQLRFGLRLGYMFSTGDAFLTQGCADPTDTAQPCSRPVVQLSISASLLHIVRISVTGEWAPPVRPGEEDLFGIRPHAGLQLIFE